MDVLVQLPLVNVFATGNPQAADEITTFYINWAYICDISHRQQV